MVAPKKEKVCSCDGERAGSRQEKGEHNVPVMQTGVHNKWETRIIVRGRGDGRTNHGLIISKEPDQKCQTKSRNVGEKRGDIPA